MKTIIIFIIGIAVGVLAYPKPYISSPGFVTAEAMAEFTANAPTCLGYSHLTNAEAAAADAPGQSVCIGWLK